MGLVIVLVIQGRDGGLRTTELFFQIHPLIGCNMHHPKARGLQVQLLIVCSMHQLEVCGLQTLLLIGTIGGLQM